MSSALSGRDGMAAAHMEVGGRRGLLLAGGRRTLVLSRWGTNGNIEQLRISSCIYVKCTAYPSTRRRNFANLIKCHKRVLKASNLHFYKKYQYCTLCWYVTDKQPSHFGGPCYYYCELMPSLRQSAADTLVRPFFPFLTPLFVTPACIPRYVVSAAVDGSRDGVDLSKFDNISANFEFWLFFKK